MYDVHFGSYLDVGDGILISVRSSLDLPDKARAALRATALKTRNTTYGEVVPASIWEHILPRLELTETDVFYDIGSGTGKIPLQVALQSLAVAKGVEFVAARHATGVKALNKLRKWAESEDVELGSAKVKAEVTSALSRVQLIQGDACVEPLDDATAIFINNTVFQPDLMATILERLAKLPNLRVVREIISMSIQADGRCALFRLFTICICLPYCAYN